VYEWSKWHNFPDPREGEYLYAPFGPGVYQLRRISTHEYITPGSGGNVAHRMSSLLPAPLGCGIRRNEDKRSYVLKYLDDVEYQTLACASKEEAKEKEDELKRNHQYVYPD
jgi:hypothetical protein